VEACYAPCARPPPSSRAGSKRCRRRGSFLRQNRPRPWCSGAESKPSPSCMHPSRKLCCHLACRVWKAGCGGVEGWGEHRVATFLYPPKKTHSGAAAAPAPAPACADITGAQATAKRSSANARMRELCARKSARVHTSNSVKIRLVP